MLFLSCSYIILSFLHIYMIFSLIPLCHNLFQVKATAENVDEAVRDLPDANLVRYSFRSMLRLISPVRNCLLDYHLRRLKVQYHKDVLKNTPS